jgi:hypothetical protein
MMNWRPGEELERFEIRPSCVTANDMINPIPPSQFQREGWKAYHPPDSQQNLYIFLASSFTHHHHHQVKV